MTPSAVKSTELNAGPGVPGRSPAAKKVYSRPTLTTYGNIAKLTQGAGTGSCDSAHMRRSRTCF